MAVGTDICLDPDALLSSAAMHWQLGLFVYLFLGKRDEAVLVLDLVSIVFHLTSAQASARPVSPSLRSCLFDVVL